LNVVSRQQSGYSNKHWDYWILTSSDHVKKLQEEQIITRDFCELLNGFWTVSKTVYRLSEY
jgi:hypothetical protein